MKKVLFTANSDRHINLCHIPYIKWFYDNDYHVDVITNTDKPVSYANKISLDFARKPFHLKNIKAVFKLKKILDSKNYDLIHTHTPVASVVTRLALKFSKANSKIIYTCHGFHFYKGAPMHYWLLFYPVEKFLMKYIDILLVMNQEDYEFSKKHFKNVDIRFVNGVGFDREKMDRCCTNKEVKQLYKNLGLKSSDFIVSYVAEFSKRKRQLDLIKSLANSDIRNENIKILLIGDDALNGKVKRMVSKYHLDDCVKVVDFSNRVNLYLTISNLVISVSRQEGLPLNIMEALYMKKLLLVSDCRGNIDLVRHGENGFVIKDLKNIYDEILYIKNNYELLYKQCENYIDMGILKYSSAFVVNEVAKIYEEVL